MKSKALCAAAAALLLAAQASCTACSTGAPAGAAGPVEGPAAAGAASAPGVQAPAPASDVEALAAGNTAFAIDLYRVLSGEPGNLFCSPYSISTALAMTWAGARAETEAEMAAAMRFDLPQERLHAAFAGLNRSLLEAGARDLFVLRTANGLWLERDFPFLEPYLALVRAAYDAEFRPADFIGSAEAARQEINAWTEEKTEGKIRDLVPAGSLTAETVLVLVNAIYFKAAWAEQFEATATEDAPFHAGAAGPVPVPMMNRVGTYAYGEDELAQVLELPYAGGRMAMTVVLPRAQDGLAAVEAALTPERLGRWTAALHDTRASVWIPRFRVEQSFQLNDALMALGMRRAFDGDDFAGMAEGGGLFISEVIHKAFVDVDEKGTEAAAATAVIMMRTSFEMPGSEVVFRADHPFLFLIRDRATGSVLFIGRVIDPAAGGSQ